MTEEVHVAGWVNEAYWRSQYIGEEDEATELLAIGGARPALSDARTEVLDGAMTKAIALDTERLSREVWVRRYRRAGERHKEGGLSFLSVFGVIALSLLMMALVWWGYAWISFALPRWF